MEKELKITNAGIGKWNISQLYKNEKMALKVFKCIRENDFPRLKQLRDSGKQVVFSQCGDVLFQLRKIYLYFQLSYLLDIQSKKYLDILEEVQCLYGDILQLFHSNEDSTIAETDAEVMEQLILKIDSTEQSLSDRYYRILYESGLSVCVNEQGREIDINQPSYYSLLMHEERDTRLVIYNTFNEKLLKKYKSEMAYILSMHLENQHITSRINNSFRDIGNAVDLSKEALKIYTSISRNINEYIKCFQSYLKINADLMEVDYLYPFDLYYELIPNYIKFDYSTGIEMVKKACSRLGKEYVEVIYRAIQEQWIDAFESKSKNKGAFCYHVEGIHPYVLVNYNETIEELLVLAHELGHAVNFYLMDTANEEESEFINPLVHEIPAILNELLVLRELCNSFTKYREIFIFKMLERNLKGLITTMMEIEFISIISNKESFVLDQDKLDSIWEELWVKYYGNKVVRGEYVKHEWLNINWFQLNEDRVSYLLGYIASFNIYESESKLMRVHYMDFLKMGRSSDISNLLKRINIDLESGNYIHQNIGVIEKYISEFNKQ